MYIYISVKSGGSASGMLWCSIQCSRMRSGIHICVCIYMYIYMYIYTSSITYGGSASGSAAVLIQ